MLAWAFATLSMRHPPLMAALTHKLQDRAFLDGFKTQELADVIWAYDQFDLLDDDLLAGLSRALAFAQYETSADRVRDALPDAGPPPAPRPKGTPTLLPAHHAPPAAAPPEGGSPVQLKPRPERPAPED